ncbi:MAG: hypothetical protein ACI4NM_05700 [Bullifex sp.]
MKRCLCFLILTALFVIPLAALPFAPASDNVSFHSSMLDVYSNPASLPFRSDLNNRFTAALDYSDSLDVKRAGEKLGLIQNMDSYLNLGFGGQNLLFSASFGFLTEDRNLTEGKLTFDFVTSNNIQLDWGWRYSNFGLGVRVRGGSQAIRENREVGTVVGIFQNFLLADYTNRAGSNYFSVGVGMQYHPGTFSLGVYTDGFLVLDKSKDLAVSADTILKTLSLGVSWRGERFDADGDLILLRPRLSLGLRNLTSSSSSLEAGAELTLQLLPHSDLTFGILYHDERDAGNNWFSITPGTMRTDLFISFLYDRYTVMGKAGIPLGGSNYVSFTVSLRAYM